MTNEQLAEIEWRFTNLKAILPDEVVALIAEVRRLQAVEAILADPAAVHMNILRGMIPLSRMNALHIAGATDYDAIKAENASLTALLERAGLFKPAATE